MKRVIFTLIGLLIASSYAFAGKSSGNKEDDYRYSVPVGSKLTLNQEIAIPPDRASIFFQYGKIVPPAVLDQWKPNCKLELRKVSPKGQIIKPDEFIITKSRLDSDASWAPIYVADIGIRSGAGTSPSNYGYHFFLKSNVQSQVRFLTCAQWWLPTDARYPTIREIRTALGDIFTLQLAK
jgi:hypothetical protein